MREALFLLRYLTQLVAPGGNDPPIPPYQDGVIPFN